MKHKKKCFKLRIVKHEIWLIFSIMKNSFWINLCIILGQWVGRIAQLEVRLTQEPEVPGFDTWSGHKLIQEGQLSVTGESMCTKYWFMA